MGVRSPAQAPLAPRYVDNRIPAGKRMEFLMAEFLTIMVLALGGLGFHVYAEWSCQKRTERLERETLENLAERADKNGEIWMPQSGHWGTWVCNLIDQGLLELGTKHEPGERTIGFLMLTDAGREAVADIGRPKQ